MAAGGPGDHPLSDVLDWGLPVYGEEADEMIRQLSRLLTRDELYNIWKVELGWDCGPNKASNRLAAKLEWAKARAEESGWEVDDT